MSLTSTTPRAIFAGNDVATSFAFSFKVESAAEVAPYFKDGTALPALLESNFSVALNADQDADPGGTVTYPTSGSPLATGDKLILLRSTDQTQELDLATLAGLEADDLELGYDKLTAIIQEMREELDRAVIFPSDESPTLADRTGYLDDAETAATEAAASAVTAAAQAVAAAASASAAASSASTASTQATTATTQATAAAASAVAAAASAAAAEAAEQGTSGLFADMPANGGATRTYFWATDREQEYMWSPTAARWFLVG
jgi:hypothetical protein